MRINYFHSWFVFFFSSSRTLYIISDLELLSWTALNDWHFDITGIDRNFSVRFCENIFMNFTFYSICSNKTVRSKIWNIGHVLLKSTLMPEIQTIFRSKIPEKKKLYIYLNDIILYFLDSFESIFIKLVQTDSNLIKWFWVSSVMVLNYR